MALIDDQIVADNGEEIALRLADLLPDATGELVLFADADAPVRLLVDAAATAQGVAVPHVTAGGVDVTGLHYVAFDNGVTLYYAGEVALAPIHPVL